MDRWISDAIDCKLTNRMGSSISVLSSTSLSNWCNFPKCQNADDSIRRHPFKFSSENDEKLAFLIEWIQFAIQL